ncbi:hypothetical protein ACQCZM_27640 [Escherichia coli]
MLKEIVFIGKAIAGIKSKIINHDAERITDKTDTGLPDCQRGGHAFGK